MKSLILAAGYGTRLYPLTENVAKALLPLDERTLIDTVIDKLDLDCINSVAVLSNKRFYTDFCSWANSREIEVVSDGSMSPDDMRGAIGDLAFFINETKCDDDLLILGSDNLFSWQLNEFCQFAQKLDAPVVGVYDMQDKALVAKRFGVVDHDENNKIIDFEEKPDNPKSALIGTCIYYLPKKCFDMLDLYFSQGHSKDAIGTFFAWLAENKDTYAFTFRGDWLDIGHKDTLVEARKLVKENPDKF